MLRFCGLFIALLVSGCTQLQNFLHTQLHPVPQAPAMQSQRPKAHAVKHAATHHARYKSSKVVVHKPGFYVERMPTKTKRAKPKPKWLRARVLIRGKALPLQFYTERVLAKSGVNVHYDVGVKAKRKLAINYAGDVQGALDQLAAATGYSYQISANGLTWRAQQTEVFSLPFLNDASPEWQARLQTELRKNFKLLLSSKGRVAFSPSTATLTVSDVATKLPQVRRYIKKLNQQMSHQVLLRVQVLSLQMRPGFGPGVNWDRLAVYMQNHGGQMPLVTAQSHLVVAKPSMSSTLSLGKLGSQFAQNLQLLMQGLARQAEVELIDDPVVTTLNNQATRVRMLRGNRMAMVRGDGFEFELLPTLQGDKVLLQVEGRYRQYGDEQQFNQRNLIPMGSTLVLSGLNVQSKGIHPVLLLVTPSVV